MWFFSCLCQQVLLGMCAWQPVFVQVNVPGVLTKSPVILTGTWKADKDVEKVEAAMS